MLTIRLARTGKKKQAQFRLVVSEKTKDTKGDYLELLGHLNPHDVSRKSVIKEDRVKYWIEKGAQKQRHESGEAAHCESVKRLIISY